MNIAEEKNIQNAWKDGSHFDLWSIVHALAGAVGGLIGLLLSLDFLVGIGIMFVVALLWEIFEYIAGFSEGFLNEVIDVLVALIGFSIAYALFSDVPSNFILLIIVALGLILTALNYVGWHAYRTRSRIR